MVMVCCAVRGRRMLCETGALEVENERLKGGIRRGRRKEREREGERKKESEREGGARIAIVAGERRCTQQGERR